MLYPSKWLSGQETYFIYTPKWLQVPENPDKAHIMEVLVIDKEIVCKSSNQISVGCTWSQ